MRPRRDIWSMQYLQENDGFIVLFVARTIEQRDLPLTHLLPQQGERLADSLQLFEIPALELGPFLWVMCEPFAKLVARRNLFQPKIHPGFLLRQASWPKPIDEDALTVLLTGFCVNALYLEFCMGHMNCRCHIRGVTGPGTICGLVEC
jgi:hypothetical protein